MKKRLISFALVIMMVAALIPLGTAANAASPVTVTFDVGKTGSIKLAPLTLSKGKSITDVVSYDDVNLRVFEDYQFYGWSLKKNGAVSDLFELDTPINADTVLYPIWVKAVDSVFCRMDAADLPGIGKSVPETVPVQALAFEDRYEVTEARWYNLNDTPLTYSTFSAGIYYLRVDFGANDGSLFRDADGHMINDTVSLKRAGLSVSGSTEEIAATFVTGSKYMAHAYFMFKLGNPLTYTVTFDANGHGIAPAPITVPSGKTLKHVLGAHTDTLSNNMFDQNYMFSGWYKVSDPESCLFPESTVISGDVTYKAAWSPIKKVSEIEMFFREPSVGDSAYGLLSDWAYAAVPPGQHVRLDMLNTIVRRTDGNYFDWSDSYEAGVEYQVEFRLTPDVGYVFAGGVTTSGSKYGGTLSVKVNGNPRDVAYDRYYDDTLYILFTFTPTTSSAANQAISKAEFTVTPPTAGEDTECNTLKVTPKQSSFVASHVAFAMKDEHGAIVSYTGKLEYGATYYAAITLFAKEGYLFQNDMKVAVLGGAELISVNVLSGRAVRAVCALTPTLPFTDVPDGSWYTQAVGECFTWGIMSGTSATTFSPGSPVTRAMFVTILARIDAADTSPYTGSYFTDVEEGKWFSKPIQWAFSNGYAVGIGSEKFGPNDPVTREQLAQFLYNYSAKKGYPTGNLADISKFVDAGAVSPWALTAVKWAVGNGLISGMPGNLLSPGTGANRAQLAVIIVKYLHNIPGSLI